MSSQKSSIEKLNKELLAVGIDAIKDVDPCPERTRYYAHLAIEFEERKDDWNKKFKSLRENYLSVYYKVVAEKYEFLLYEKTNDKVYWNYNEETGVYDELSFPEVRNLIIAMLIKDDFNDKANEAAVKSILNKYRSAFKDRGKFYDDFTSNDEWFHANNGWVNLETLEFQAHTSDRLSRFSSAIPYRPDAICPLYDSFLDVESRMPADQVRVLDQYSGYILTNTIEAKQMLIFEGRPGSGKSMLPEIWQAILGKKAVAMSLKKLSGDNNRFSGDELAGKNFCFIDEASPKTKDINESFQNLVTQPTITVERKSIQEKPVVKNQLKMILSLNEMPDHMPPGMLRRYRHILFKRSFYDEGVQDTKIQETILKDELSGVFNRMLKGLADYKKMGGFTVIAGDEERRQEYDLISDDFSSFLNEHFEPVPSSDDEVRYSYKEVRDAFVAEYPKKYNAQLSIQGFNKKLISNRLAKFSRINKSRKKGQRGYIGFKLKEGHNFVSNEKIFVLNQDQEW